MGNIVLLDDLTINKIAAGEVIERPASVVKEMLENSIDADATNVNIEIQNGGITKIRISDNGKGIEPDDMVIAFERHATSKIRQADDLEYVKTMGFRGEALASIAAISKVEMLSRTAESGTGYKVVVEAGNIISEEITACPVGTTIIVEKLFFNTPVRYKFLKKDYTEAGYIEDSVKRIALINSNVAIKLINNGKTVIQTKGNGKLEDVIYGIYGKDIVNGLLPIDYKYENIFINGVIGKPEIARSNRSNQMFFINNRFVKDKTLSAAVEQAMKGMLPIGKFPFLVMNIKMDPKKVDVNVHPAKLEVRFVDESEIFKSVMHAIKDTLQGSSLINNISKEADVEDSYQQHYENKTNREQLLEELEEAKVKREEAIKNNIEANENIGIDKNELEDSKVKEPRHFSKNIVDLFKKVSRDKEKEEEELVKKENINIIADVYKNKAETISKEPVETIKSFSNEEKNKIFNVKEEDETYVRENLYNFEEVKEIENVKNDSSQEPPQNFETMYEKTFGDVPASVKRQEVKFDNLQYVNNENLSMFTKNDKYSGYKYIGTVFSTYIVLEVGDEMYMLDQHAAHERIMYEKVKDNYYSNNKDCQMMLLPDVITLTNKEVCVLRDNRDIFEKAGFSVEEFGDNTVKLTGVPSMCMDMDTKVLFLDILDEIDNVARTERQEIEERFIATVACKSAVKANMVLESQEVVALLDKLMELPNPFTCPHGRPTAIKMTKNDIERKFSRR